MSEQSRTFSVLQFLGTLVTILGAFCAANFFVVALLIRTSVAELKNELSDTYARAAKVEQLDQRVTALESHVAVSVAKAPPEKK